LLYETSAAYNPSTMRRIKHIAWAVAAILVLCGMSIVQKQLPAWAEAAGTPSLVISQLKITSGNGQFVTLYNATNTALDMSEFQLEYFNNYDLSKATSSRLIALSGIVPPHGYFIVNDNAMQLCYQLTINSASLGFSSTAGLIEVLAFNQASVGGSVVPELQDYVGWSKTAASGVQTLPTDARAFLLRQPVDAQNNPSISAAGNGTWQSVQPDAANPCDLVTTTLVPVSVKTGLNQLLPTTEAPATIIFASNDSGLPAASLPASDIGLISPSVTELLPNPTGTGNDASDEFVELYNPNKSAFDLTGFSLVSGTTSTHTYVFPAGSTIAAGSFKAYYSADTGLSFSNSGGQAKLLDPFGNSIAISNVYGTAKDGQAWVAAKGKWYWTLTPTPGKANIVKQPPATTKSKSKKPAGSKVKGASTAKSKAGSSAATAGSFTDEPSTTPIHTWALAIIGCLALIYGAYEYRADITNKSHQLKRYLSSRRADRS
jgi:hypothetical protein